MECQALLAHLDNMGQHAGQITNSNATLGQRAKGRAAVDLLLEAERLNFSTSEIAELRRLYAADNQFDQAKTPQKAV